MVPSLCGPCETSLKLISVDADALSSSHHAVVQRHVQPGVCSLCDLILRLTLGKHPNLSVSLYWDLGKDMVRRPVFTRPDCTYLQIYVPVPEPDGSRFTKYIYVYYLLLADPIPSIAATKAILHSTRVIQESGSPEALNLVKAWFDQCSAHHDCPKGPRLGDVDRSGEGAEHEPILPSRVLHIGTQPSDDIRVITSHGRRGSYAALSYCWGSADHPPPKTTDASLNLVQSRTGHVISFSTLPATFRDAITLTRHLGLTYLWIDSLCIVQDSKTDWEQEASKMGDYFSNAQVVIGASSSDSPWKGIFKPYNIPNVEIPFFDGLGSSAGTVRAYLYEAEHTVPPWYRHTPIALRGWTLQETVLAQRLVLFTERTTLWRCSEICCDEVQNNPIGSGPNDTLYMDPFSRLINFAATPDLDNDFWNWVLMNYSARAFTYPKDKLPALKGLCDRYEKRMGAPIWFGLRSDHLLEDLHWYREDDYGHDPPLLKRKSPGLQPTSGQVDAPRIPTWSWLSIDEPVTYSHWANDYNDWLDSPTEGWECTVQATSESGKLACEGPCGLVRINTNDQHPWSIRSTKGLYIGAGYFCRHPVSDQFYCLFTRDNYGLILQPVERQPKHFTRVGVAFLTHLDLMRSRAGFPGIAGFPNTCIFLM